MAPDSITVTLPTAVTQLSGGTVIHSELLGFIHSVVVNKHGDDQEPFFVLDLGTASSLRQRWIRNLPDVQPFYAIKSNPEPLLLTKLAELGCSFDCASRGEIENILSLGVPPDRIIFANTCKAAAHIKYAEKVGVNLTTFDSEFELLKIQKLHPNSDLLIRIKVEEDPDSVFLLAKKFGALNSEIEPLLRAALALQLRVVGVSFHVGSGFKRGEVFSSAIELARKVFDVASRLGMPKMRLLNIGGGFTEAGRLFEAASETIKSALNYHFGDEPELTVIAEPGRFFAGPPFTLVTNIIGKRVRDEVREYWINDGVYGSVKFQGPTPFAGISNAGNVTDRGEKAYKSIVFGPTCASEDTVLTDIELPELQIGDWLIFPEFGAYTKSKASNFNAFKTDSVFTYSANHSNLARF